MVAFPEPSAGIYSLDIRKAQPRDLPQVCRTLAYIHERGVVHCDVKPANILIPGDGEADLARPKLADFGIAAARNGVRAVTNGTTVGTANYLSPRLIGDHGWRAAYRVYAVAGAILLVVAFLLAERPPPATTRAPERATTLRVGSLLTRRAMRHFRRRMDYSEYGGAPLLGVAGITIVGHGRSGSKAVRNAIAMAYRFASGQVMSRLEREIAAATVTQQ